MSKIKLKFIIALLFYSTFVFSQNKEKFVFIDSNIIEADSSITLYLSFKVPNKNLVFKKNSEDSYKAGISINYEISSNKNIIDRASIQRSISVQSYDETIRHDSFLQGLSEIKLQSGNYEIKPFISIDNSQISFIDEPIIIERNKYLNIANPIICSLTNEVCSGSQLKLVNLSNMVNYGDYNSIILLPADNKYDSLHISLRQEGKIILEKSVGEKVLTPVKFTECEKGIFIEGDSTIKKNQTYFILRDFGNKIMEGKVKIIATSNKDTVHNYFQEVYWLNKPKSLSEPETAFKFLEMIESKDKLKELLKNNNDDYLLALNQYWVNKNPNKNDTFNRLKEEYYSRIDYAIQNYDKNRGSKTNLSDRSKIYIRFGKPDQEQRIYHEGAAVKEVWYYKNLNRQFIFVDLTGLGNYTLEK
jgi:GWxTD domain-containing protein